MKISNRISNLSHNDSPRGRLALMTLCTVLVGAAIAKQLPAQAAEPSAAVSLSDLDLSSEKGMQEARKRVHQTAQRLCGKVVDPWALSHHEDYVRCVDEATTAAVVQLHGLMLAANAKSPTPEVSAR
jgi:UrcA family protein